MDEAIVEEALPESDHSQREGGALVEILWTGGYDSTFRMLQLSRMDVTVQPYYLSDERKSEEYELNAMRVIADKLRARPETKFRLLPLIVVPRSERPENAQITAAYWALRKQIFFGLQYDWLARFAAQHPGIELGIELTLHDNDKALKAIHQFGALREVSDEILGNYAILDQEKSAPELCLLFGNYHLPLVGFTKQRMREIYREWGCEDIMNSTWFCFRPINGRPCGRCHPCQSAISEGMWRRLPPSALLRYGCVRISDPIKRRARRIRKALGGKR